MKKNISINISGIIFHIEEDGYEILRKYLDSINRYFSSFEDNSEILSDIESRIAEILLSKLSEGKQVVTAEDVNALMATMGSVNDFKAAEEQEASSASSASSGSGQKQQRSSASNREPIASKKLFRDEKRKILGGVCAGLAHYFNIDPVWPRILFALIAIPTYGGFLIAYIILWIVIPPSATLEEDEDTTAKKMYRDRDNKVVGGVASGLAAYSGLDATVVRVLFIILSIMGGFGVVVYIIMWIAVPEAKTITEKMEMQGEPVTLSNIESSVKKGLNEKDGTEESVFAKIILFPFRLIAAFIDALARILGPVFLLAVDVFRIAFGLVFTMTGAGIIFGLVIAFSVMLGFIHFPDKIHTDGWFVSTADFPLEAIRHSFPTWPLIFAFIAALIPALMVSLLGASIIAKKIVFNAYVGWSLFVVFFISVGVLASTVPQMVYSFKEDGEHKVEQVFNIAGIPYLKINETGLDDYDVTDLTILPYDGKEIKLVQRFESQGASRKDAVENAQMVEYKVVQSDSVLTFDSNITFKTDAKFRAQRLDMDLYIPTNRPFMVDEGIWRLIDNHWDNSRWDRHYYRGYEDKHLWKLNEFGLMDCIDCAVDTDEEKTDIPANVYGYRDFNTIDLEGLFDVTIVQGDDWSVDIEGSESVKDMYRIYTTEESLVIDYEDDRKNFWKRDGIEGREIEVRITMPHLRELDVQGAGKIKLRGFNEQALNLKLLGAVMADADIEVTNLEINLTGTSFLELKGSGISLDADITGASGLRAYGYEVRNAVVEAHGASHAKVNVTERLEISKGITSSVSHKGNPRVVEED